MKPEFYSRISLVIDEILAHDKCLNFVYYLSEPIPVGVITTRYDNSTKQLQKFEARFLFLLFAEENFYSDIWKSTITESNLLKLYEQKLAREIKSILVDFWSSRQHSRFQVPFYYKILEQNLGLDLPQVSLIL